MTTRKKTRMMTTTKMTMTMKVKTFARQGVIRSCSKKSWSSEVRLMLHIKILKLTHGYGSNREKNGHGGDHR